MALPTLAAIGTGEEIPPDWTPALRDALLAAVYSAGSDDIFLPVQDVFGWRDRVNTPATVGPENWTWRFPWPIDRWSEVPEARERAEWCRREAAAAGRLGD
jgi:4-alpha-glucanotransferase